jgi:dUTPase
MYRKGDKIAQLVFSNYLRPEIKMVEELNKTERGTGGCGSSGD